MIHDRLRQRDCHTYLETDRGGDEGEAFLRTVALTFRVLDRRYEERPLRRTRLNARYDELGLASEGLLTDGFALFGGIVSCSFGFGSFLLSALPAAETGPLLRRAFAHFYAFVIERAFAGAALTAAIEMTSAIILRLIGFTALLAR